MVVVEDLYRPYRPKRRTRAMIAKEKGLEPLAALITLQKAEKPIEVYADFWGIIQLALRLYACVFLSLYSIFDTM